MDGLIVDNFAGGGGASTGLRAAVGRPVDVAINHSPEAIAMHARNHPETRHFCESVWEVDPREVAGSRRVAYVWLSPDCTHFSKAKGGQPRSKGVRSLAWTTIRWARLPRSIRPRVMFLENVEEFEDWGPLDASGMPDKGRAGETFHAFVSKLKSFGYQVEWRLIVAADHGAPTTRKRLFMVARCDGKPIVWPEATHGKGRARPWRTAAEVIDWTLPCPSIFGRKRPLADATMRRIAAGLKRYAIDAAQPFIVPVKSWGGGGNGPRSINEPFRTVTCSKRGEFALVSPFIAPVTHTKSGDRVHRIDEPLRTVTTKARFGLVTVQGVEYQITDIGLRMLAPRELFNAQGFPDDYVIELEHNGRPLTKTQQIELAGNSVCPDVARDIVAANLLRSRKVAA